MHALLNTTHLVAILWAAVIVVALTGVCIYIAVLYISNCNWDKNIMLNILCLQWKHNNLELGSYLRRRGGGCQHITHQIYRPTVTISRDNV